MAVATESKGRRGGRGGGRSQMSGEARQALGRAIAYLWRYPKETGIALGALLLALGAQLAVPQFVQRMIDTITNNAEAKQILEMPASAQQAAAENFGLDPASLQINLDNAPSSSTHWCRHYCATRHHSRGTCIYSKLHVAGTLPQHRLRVPQRPILQNPTSLVSATTTATAPDNS